MMGEGLPHCSRLKRGATWTTESLQADDQIKGERRVANPGFLLQWQMPAGLRQGPEL